MIRFQRVGIHTFGNWDTLKGMFPNKIPDSKKVGVRLYLSLHHKKMPLLHGHRP